MGQTVAEESLMIGFWTSLPRGGRAPGVGIGSTVFRDKGVRSKRGVCEVWSGKCGVEAYIHRRSTLKGRNAIILNVGLISLYQSRGWARCSRIFYRTTSLRRTHTPLGP